MASDVAEVLPKVVITGGAFSWKMFYFKCLHWQPMYLIVSSPKVLAKLTDERTWDLKVGFDVDQLRLAAADPVFFSLEKKVEQLPWSKYLCIDQFFLSASSLTSTTR